MKKVAKFGILALLLVSLVASAFAFSSRGFGNEAAREALEAGDYASWKTAMIAELTEENFNQMAERHGQMDEKRAAMLESREQRYEGMAEKRAAMQEANEKIQQALEAGDHDAWVEAVSTSGRNSRMAETITEENFETYVKLHEARQNQEWETVKQLSEELGLENLEGRKGFKRGMFRHFKGQFGCGMASE